MRPGNGTVRDETALFDRAVRDRALAVVTVQTDDGWQSFKCRFMERDPDRRFFVLDYEPHNGTELPALSLGQYVGVSFRHGSRKILFASIVEAKGQFDDQDGRAVRAVRYRWPQGITEMQRRAFYRTPVPDNLMLLASIWPGGITRRTAAQSESLEIITGELADISCGGCLIRLHQPTAPAWGENATLGLEIDLADGRPPVQVDAHCRGCRVDRSGRMSLAAQFVGLEVNVDGRIIMQRLSNVVRRLSRIGDPVKRTSR